MRYSPRITLIVSLIVSLIIFPSLSPGKEITQLPSLANLAKELKPTVVNISTTKLVKSPLDDFFRGFRDFHDFFGDEFFKRFFGDRYPREFRQKSLGSGFIIDKEGYILTNHHVVEKAEEIKVKLSDKKIYDAQVIGKDPKTDLALIKIEADGDLPVARLGDSDRLEVGEWVIAIGNPFGLEQTVTAGIISAKGRVIGAGPYDDFLQTDASINPGNSGGPLFNLKGEVVGINTAIVAGGQGIGFAIPINMATRLLPQLKKGRVVYGYLGVYIQDLTPELAHSFGLKEPRGALISEVIPDTPAEKGGLKKADVVLEYDGKEVKDRYQFTKMVGRTPIGKKVKIVVLRKGKHKTLSLTIGELKEKQVAATKPEEIDRWGLKVQDVTPELAAHLGLPDDEGVVITEVEPGSPTQEAGLRGGDVIIEVEHHRIRDLGEYRKYIGRYKKKRTLLLTVRMKAHNYHTFFVVLKKKG
ncbi:MAG: DegQ family serine endoprotease [Deltaproteobacteria bacterium]|nr:DegQ family serine endoprotease [Deltaproteobacteria bacterium]